MSSQQSVLELKPMELPPLSEKPLVSVLVANYNYARYIGDALESMLAQTYPHFELIVCDDGSSDDSCAVIESYVKRDRRIRLVRKENGGVASALNVAYAVAKGEIICFLDADDLFYPEKLERVVSAFGNQPTFGFFIHQVLPVSETREPIYLPSPKALENGWTGSQALRRGGDGRNFPPCSGLCLRRQVTDHIFPLPLQFRRGADGYFRGAAQFLTSIIAVPQVLAEWRIHGNSVTRSDNLSPPMISKFLEDSLRIFRALKGSLNTYYGEQVADNLRLEDNYSHWELLLALYILEGKPQGGVRGYTVGTLLERFPQTPRKRLWQLVLLLPSSIAKRALHLWWGMAPEKSNIKKIVAPIWRLLRLSTWK